MLNEKTSKCGIDWVIEENELSDKKYKKTNGNAFIKPSLNVLKVIMF